MSGYGGRDDFSKVDCEACGRQVPYTSHWVWVAMLRNMQIAHARVCWHCAQKALLIPGLDPLNPPMTPDTPASPVPSRWRWLWLSGDLSRTPQGED